MHLFPSIQPPKKKVLKDMRLQVSVGQFSEGNLSEAKVSILQCRAALKQPLDLYNIREIDASLGKTLETIYASHQAWLRSEGAQPMAVDGVRVEDLCLTFELPGKRNGYHCQEDSLMSESMFMFARSCWQGLR